MEDHIIQFFTFTHLPEKLQKLQKVSAPFTELAGFITTLPRNPERTVALRKLLEAKDAAIAGIGLAVSMAIDSLSRGRRVR